MKSVDPEIQKLIARNARLRAERGKSIATKASVLLREAMRLIEDLDPEPGLTLAVDHLTKAVEALISWEPKGR